MKKIILLSLIVLFSISAGYAQRNKEAIDPAKAQELFNARVKFMQEELMLSPEQTEKFTPIYKNYLTSIRSIKHPQRIKDKDVKTTDEAYKGIVSQLKFKRDILDAQEKGVAELKNVLNAQQLTKFLKAEHKIQHKIRDAKEHREKKNKNVKSSDRKRDRK